MGHVLDVYYVFRRDRALTLEVLPEQSITLPVIDDFSKDINVIDRNLGRDVKAKQSLNRLLCEVDEETGRSIGYK